MVRPCNRQFTYYKIINSLLLFKTLYEQKINYVALFACHLRLLRFRYISEFTLFTFPVSVLDDSCKHRIYVCF